MPSKPRLIVRLPNWVGDVIMALPALDLLSAAGFDLHLFGKRWIKDLLSETPYHLHTINHSFCTAQKKIRACNARHALLLTNSFSSALLFRLSGLKTLGYNTDARRFLLSHAYKKTSNTHETVIFSQLAHYAIEKWQDVSSSQQAPLNLHLERNPTLPLNKNLITSVNSRFNTELETPYWVICPFAVGTTKSGAPKIWPHWQALISRLSNAKIKLIICPGPDEQSKCLPYAEHIVQLDGLSLSEYAVVLRGAAQVIANDSGPMHLAQAVGAPTLGIFGVTDPARTSAIGSKALGSNNGWPTLKEVLAQLTII